MTHRADNCWPYVLFFVVVQMYYRSSELSDNSQISLTKFSDSLSTTITIILAHPHAYVNPFVTKIN